MSTRFYSGQKDYIVQLNLMEDEWAAGVATVTGKANRAGDTFTGAVSFTNGGAGTPSITLTQSADNPYIEWQRWTGGGTIYQGFRQKVTTNSMTWDTGPSADKAAQVFTTAMTLTNGGNLTVTGTMTATTFNGALNGNANTATSATTATNANNAAVSVESGNSTFYPVFVSATSGNTPLKVSNTKLTFNPSTGALVVTGSIAATGGLDLSGGAADAVTASLAQGNDNNFKLRATNGVATNVSGDTVSRFGLFRVGTATMVAGLDFKRGGSSTDGYVDFWSNSAVQGRISNGGRWLIGTTTDDGATRLQVNGVIKAVNGIVATNGGDGEVTIGTDAQGSIEIGKTGRTNAGTPYMDWHSSANSPDFDVRLQASGGSGTNGQGTMTVSAATTAMTGNATVGGNLTVTGNLTINGTTTTVNSTTVTVDDPTITLGGDTAPTSDDGKDRGVEFRWHNGTTAKLGFFGFDDSTGKWTFIPDATNTSEVFSGTAGTLVANLEGAVTGNASTATILQTARTINGVSFNGSANITVTANTPNAVTFNNGGAGAASGSTYNGGAAITVSYNTVGAPSTTGTNASGTWGISVSGNAATVTNGVYTTGDQAIAGNKTFSGYTTFSVTSALNLPVGTTAQRPAGTAGDIRLNSTTGQFEGHTGTGWNSVGGGAKGGGPDQIFNENDTVMTTSYSITAGKNANTTGPLTINSGIALTVPDGSRLVIL